MLGQLALALDPAEVVAELRDEIDGRVVQRDLAPQQIACQAEGRIGRGPMNAPDRSLQVGERLVEALVAGHHRLGAADELHLVHVVHVDAELRQPLRRVDHRRVDAERPAADEAVGEPAKALYDCHGADLRSQSAVDAVVGDVAETLCEADARLVEGAGVGQHGHQARVLRVDVGEHRDRLGAELRRDSRVLRPRPDGKVEDDGVHALGRETAAVAHRDVIAPDHLVSVHDLEAIGLEPARERQAKLLVHRRQRRLKERTPITKIQQPHLDPPSFQMLQHVRSLSAHVERNALGVQQTLMSVPSIFKLNLKRVSFLLTCRATCW